MWGEQGRPQPPFPWGIGKVTTPRGFYAMGLGPLCSPLAWKEASHVYKGPAQGPPSCWEEAWPGDQSNGSLKCPHKDSRNCFLLFVSLGWGGGCFTSRIASLERQGPWGQTGDTVSTRALCFPSFLPDVSWNPAHLKAGPKGSRIVKPKGVLVTVQTEAESFPRKVQEVVPAPAHAGPSGQGQGRCQESPDEGRSGRGWGCPGGWRDSGRAHGGTLSPKPPSVLQALPVAAEDSGWHIMVLPFLRGGPRGNGGGGACPGWAPRSSTAFHVEPPFRKDRDMVSTRAAGDCMTRATCISRVLPAGRPGRQCNRNSLPTDEETGFGDRVTHAAQRSKCWNTPWSRPWTLGLRFFSESGF